MPTLTLADLSRVWLRDQLTRRPYSFAARAERARAENADTYGTNYSCILDGSRIFIFELERARDAFVKAYSGKVVPMPTRESLA